MTKKIDRENIVTNTNLNIYVDLEEETLTDNSKVYNINVFIGNYKTSDSSSCNLKEAEYKFREICRGLESLRNCDNGEII